MYNFKNVVYPNTTSRKRHTRLKQLSKRSQQAKYFDFLINIGYWEPLIVVKEFPIVISNAKRVNGVEGGFYLLDYYFPTLRLAVELDSEYHDPKKDKLRDAYLENIGIKTFRMSHLERESVQKRDFIRLRELVKSIVPSESPGTFDFTTNIRAHQGL